jgi:dihydrofolate reductase
MAKLIFSARASLDGYVADRRGCFDWAEPDEEVHTFGNEIQRPVGTYLYRRRMYEVMVAWEGVEKSARPVFVRDFAEIWRLADKIAYSSSLERVASARTRIERHFDLEGVREMKARLTQDMTVSGPGLAAHAFICGLVDECQLFLAPVIAGGGTQTLPEDVRQKLKLLDERRFANGTVYLHYRTTILGGEDSDQG